MKKLSAVILLTLVSVVFLAGCNQKTELSPSAKDQDLQNVTGSITIEDSKDKEVSGSITILPSKTEESKEVKATDEALTNANKALSEASKLTEGTK